MPSDILLMSQVPSTKPHFSSKLNIHIDLEEEQVPADLELLGFAKFLPDTHDGGKSLIGALEHAVEIMKTLISHRRLALVEEAKHVAQSFCLTAVLYHRM